MQKLLVLRDTTLNQGDPADVTNVNELNQLVRGALSITVDGHNLYDPGVPLPDRAEVMFHAGVAPSQKEAEQGIVTKVDNSVSIHRRAVTKITRQNYVAPVNPIWTIGGAGAGQGLTFDTEGEAEIVVKNLSYNHVVSSQDVRVSEVRRPGDTDATFLARLVDRLNGVLPLPANIQRFFTATAIGAPPDEGIELEANNPHVEFAVALGGMFELNRSLLTTPPTFSLGDSADLARKERDWSKHVGYGGYEKLNDLWWTQPIETEIGAIYDIFSIMWTGVHDTPQNKINAASNILQIATPNGAAIGTVVQTALVNLFGNAFDPIEGAETGTEPIVLYTDNDPTT